MRDIQFSEEFVVLTNSAGDDILHKIYQQKLCVNDQQNM